MKSKKSILIGVTSLLLVMLLLLGLTYAYYRTRIIGNESTEPSISVTSKSLEVVYKDGTSSIDLGSKVQPGSSFTKAFTVENTGEEIVYFSVILDSMTNTFQRDEDWTYVLTKGGSQIASGTIAVGTHQVLVATDNLASGTASYVLTVTYANPTDIDQSDDMGSQLSFRVNISDEVVTWENPAAPSWAAEGATTLISAIKTNNTASNLTTIPGQQPSEASEQGIGSTQDDYGTSYYFRGNVQNNYVTYSGMCWRIVRVQGDGTIKIVLADGTHPCGTANGYSATDTDSAFVADAEGNARMDIAYKSNVALDATDFLFANSDIPLVLSTWAEDKKLDLSQLVETEWCNDTAHTGYNYYDDDHSPVPAGSNSINPDYTEKAYGALKRLGLWSRETAEPSLKCNTKGIAGSTGIKAQATRYKNVLGILSADEIAFAGSTSNIWLESATWDYYLKTNATRNFYWTMSPYYSGVDNDFIVLFVNTTGDLSLDDGNGAVFVDVNIGSVRPAVVLRSDVTIEDGGNGQIDTPYVIR